MGSHVTDVQQVTEWQSEKGPNNRGGGRGRQTHGFLRGKGIPGFYGWRFGSYSPEAILARLFLSIQVLLQLMPCLRWDGYSVLFGCIPFSKEKTQPLPSRDSCPLVRLTH